MSRGRDTADASTGAAAPLPRYTFVPSRYARSVALFPAHTYADTVGRMTAHACHGCLLRGRRLARGGETTTEREGVA